MHATPLRRRIAGATMALGAIFVAMSLVAPSAHAGAAVTDPFFNTDTDTYDTYLHDEHRGTPATASGFEGTCPTDESVAGLTAWHLVLTDSDQDYSTLDVRVEIDGVATTLSLTPKAKGDWAGFDPTANFMADPSLKHAYVYAGDADDVLVDAAAQVTPDGPADKIVLSHICPGEESTDTGSTDTGTTDTGSVLGSTGSQDTGGTDTEVKGEVIEQAPQQLPATGSGDQSLFIIGMACLTVGSIAMVARRKAVRS